jgi:hypothetical protein
VLSACGGDDDDQPVGPLDPRLAAMCVWLGDVQDSAVVRLDVTEENLEQIGSDAAALAAAGRQLRLGGQSQERLADSVFRIEFIRDAAVDANGLVSIPTYKQLLSEQLDALLRAVQDEYGFAPGVGPCIGVDR